MGVPNLTGDWRLSFYDLTEEEIVELTRLRATDEYKRWEKDWEERIKKMNTAQFLGY